MALGELVQLLGRKEMRMGPVTFRRCPGCGIEGESFIGGPGGLVHCHLCRGEFPPSEFKVVTRSRSIAVCNGCGRQVSLTPANEGWLGYLCAHCNNYVAVHYGNHRLQPSIPLKVTWNSDAGARARAVGRTLRFLECRTKKDFLVVKLLQVLAQQEHAPFRSVSSADHKAALFFRSDQVAYIGFLVWTEEKAVVLRQIFVKPQHRRRGYASDVLRFWERRRVEPLRSSFGVESPNDRTLRLLVKLGYARMDGEHVIGVRCFFLPSGL